MAHAQPDSDSTTVHTGTKPAGQDDKDLLKWAVANSSPELLRQQAENAKRASNEHDLVQRRERVQQVRQHAHIVSLHLHLPLRCPH